MRINRRGALALLGAGAMATPAGAKPASKVSFRHGVASGDPSTTAAIFWTRVTPDDPGAGDLTLTLEVAADPGFRKIVRSSKGLRARTSRDFTVKHDLDGQGLEPGTDYWYRFTCEGVVSPVGRTRTLPEGALTDLVLAVASCSLHPAGYFNAYGAIAALERVDAVVHLGDYIYEYGSAPGEYGTGMPVSDIRIHEPPHECLTLADYRLRHAQYKADLQTQAAHAKAPWIVVWDDHETANDSWTGGAENHNPDKGDGDWAARKAAALQAYFEWMPIRDPAPGRLREDSFRSFRFGDLASLVMLETRLTARDKPLEYDDKTLPIVDGRPDIPHFMTVWQDPERRMTGARQEQWLKDELYRSVKDGETWQVIGNQVVMARVSAPNLPAQMGPQAWGELVAKLPDYARDPVLKAAALSPIDIPLTLDTWDGYPVNRERLYEIFRTANAHPVVLSGDSHSFWANELWDVARKTRIAAEFGTTGVTSPGFEDILQGAPLGEAFVARNPEVKFADSAAKGFVLLTLTREQAKAEFVAVSTIFSTDYTSRVIRTFVTAPAKGPGVEALRAT